MKKACPKCGCIHDRNFHCRAAVQPERKTQADIFRGRKHWKKKREDIRTRDYNMCRVCLDQGVYKRQEISVHHITPLSEDYSKRLDDDNLICLCSFHHELAEAGLIPADYLRQLAASVPDVNV